MIEKTLDNKQRVFRLYHELLNASLMITVYDRETQADLITLIHKDLSNDPQLRDAVLKLVFIMLNR